VIAYQPDQWHDLFVAMAGAAATLAGLIFVAVSLNHEQILELAALPALAARSLIVLVGLVVASIFVLTPGQDSQVLGAEILVTGLLLTASSVYTSLKAMTSETQARWKVSLLSVALISTLPMVAGGSSLLARAGGGLYWLMVEMVLGLTAAIYYAWVLLIEIRR
jgi:modulator of FtsH protease